LTPNQLHNLNIERAILSAIIFEPTLYEDVASKLSPEDFYLPDHQVIFQCMEELDREEQPIDEEFLKKKLLQKKRYNEDVFIEIISANPISNVTAYVEEIKEKAIKRELVKLTSRIREVTVEDDLPSDDILNIVQKELYEISLDANTKEFRESPEMVAATIAHIHEMKKRGNNGVTGVDTGFRELNELTAGFGEGQLIIIAARPAMGKCLAKGTKVLMYDGSLKAVEDIERGELLMGDDSTPRKVLSIARGRERMYWIRQKKGIDYRVNESHILSLKRSRSKGKDKQDDVLNISVREYLQKSDKFKSRYKGYKVPVKFMEKDLGIEPYFLGLWLGKGRKSDLRIATEDKEVVRYLKSYAKRFGLELIKAELRRLGVLENKHIPNNYLINSTQKRLELLAGLIDSDGRYDKERNGYEITRISKSLARQIKFLADSLGFRTSLKKKKSAVKATGFEGVAYRVRIFGNIDRVPVKIARKKAQPWFGKRSWNQTGIKVEFDKVDDYYGFEIDGNSLFLLEDMTVTHNTAFTLNLAQKALDDNRGVAIFSLEMPAEELMLRMLSAKTSIPLQNLKVGDLTDEEWSHLSRATDEMSQKKLFVDDDGLININQLRSKLRKIKTQNPEISLAIIDYLQLMSGTGSKDRHLEVSEISRGLKLLARELQIPIIALSQLNRGLESRHDKRPMLSDIRESGSIEQDADIIMFVYRDDVYKMREEKEKEKRAKAEGKEYKSEFVSKAEEEAEVIIGKNRSGPIGTAHLVFQKRFTRFVDKGNVPVEIVFENAEENAKNSKIELPPI
jgi:replicative DNA helicase